MTSKQDTKEPVQPIQNSYKLTKAPVKDLYKPCRSFTSPYKALLSAL